jgi:osmotically-inducible protein OsmY
MAKPAKPKAIAKAEEIRKSVSAELEFDPLIDSTDITVKNMGGDVALNGTVPSYPQYLKAADAARRVQGVTKVHNHLMVSLPPSDYRDDPLLTTAANNALTQNVTLPRTLEASASEGNVWLTGWVPHGSQRQDAEMAIAPLPGVRSIADDIEVISDTAAVAGTTDRVRDALDRTAVMFDDSEIFVQASDGTITLTGHVLSWLEHDAAVDAAWRGQGVKEVRDEVAVTGW